MSKDLFIRNVKSLWQAITGDTPGAKTAQDEFLKALSDPNADKTSGHYCLVEKVPIVGHDKGLIHLALGKTISVAHSEAAATRTLAVLGAGALTTGTGGAAVPILAGVAVNTASDAVITGDDSQQHNKYDPQGYFAAISEFSSDWRGGAFDVIALGVGDAIISDNGIVTKGKFTTKVFRVEGESIFLNNSRERIHLATSRLFSGPGGAAIESPNIIKIIVPNDEDEKRIQFKPPAVLFLNVGGTPREETCYEQKMLLYNKAVESLKADPDVPGSPSPPAAFTFKIKSFRILTNDAEKMSVNDDCDDDDSEDTAKVHRVDITKTGTSSECPQPVYTPILTNAIPDTFGEPRPAWVSHLPARLKEAIINHHVIYDCVRTFVIKAPQIPSQYLKPAIVENASFVGGAVAFSSLSPTGVDNIVVQNERVSRLLQSRELKCGRTLRDDPHHQSYMQYLAQFADGSTSWIPSSDIAPNLKQEFWRVMTTDAKEVAQVISADTKTGTIEVKRPDGTQEVVKQSQLFWQEETSTTRLTDAELDALFHHGHFGFDTTDFLPCTIDIHSDWMNLQLQDNIAVIMKDPAADKAGLYADFKIDSTSIRLGQRQSYKFVHQRVPFFIANNGRRLKIDVTHGRDGMVINDHRGSVVLSLSDTTFTSGFVQSDAETNPSTFDIEPLIVTPGLLSVDTDWAAISIDSSTAIIGPDPTINDNVYKHVAFSPTSMKLQTDVFGQNFVIPFVLSTKQTKVNVKLTHGRDKSLDKDMQGVARVLFAQNTYTGGYVSGDEHLNTHRFSDCPTNKQPPAIPL